MKKNLTKIALIAMSVVILGLAIAVGTLAYLNDKTDPIKNVFIVSANIELELVETKGTENGDVREFKVIPGATIKKDPKLTVKKGSEACYVFVKVDTNLVNYADNKMVDEKHVYDATWAIDSAWTLVPGQTNVYYLDQAELVNADADVEYAILKNDEIVIANAGITTPLGGAANYYMNFIGYAIQSANLTNNQGAVTTPEGAWALLCTELGLN